MQQKLRSEAKALLEQGKVDCIAGFQPGSLKFTTTPLITRDAADTDRLVINDFIVNNLAVFLTELEGRVGIVVKGCDSCAFSIYTRMPVENPREEKWQRVRQKVSHKYEFYPMNFGIIACTGCGRCIRLCPVNWDITQTLESLPDKSTA